MHGESADAAHEPLIARDEHDGITTDNRGQIDNLVASRSLHKGSDKVLWLLTLSAGLSGLLFGYDTGVISSTLISLGTSLSRETTTFDKSLIASATSFFALLVSPLSGYIADLLGRKPVIAIATFLFILGALVQAFATRVWIMVAGRSIVGAAIGAASGIVPLYIAEIAPAEKRGRFVTVQSLFITGGQVAAYLVGWVVQGRWRIAVGVGAAPAVLQGVLLLATPESPRWLVLKGREEEAKRVLQRLGQGRDVDIEEVLGRIRDEVSTEGLSKGEGGWKTLITVPGHRRALTIACMLQALQQLCGFNVLMYFSATIFSLVGFTSPVATSLSIAGTNFLFTLFAFVLIDTLGRRKILLLSIPFMVLGLVLCAISFLYIHPRQDATNSALINTTGGHLIHPNGLLHKNALFPYALLASLILYVSAYALGLGCVPWQQSELFPLSVRSAGSGIATATNWSSNFVVGVSFLPMMEWLGPSLTFTIYALVCVAGWVAVLKFYPETMGLALEDVGALLARGWGVKEEDRGLFAPVDGEGVDEVDEDEDR